MPKKDTWGMEPIKKESIVTIISGSISVQRKGSSKLVSLTTGMTVNAGDTICWSGPCEWEVEEPK
jgi:hypothetical protein